MVVHGCDTSTLEAEVGVSLEPGSHINFLFCFYDSGLALLSSCLHLPGSWDHRYTPPHVACHLSTVTSQRSTFSGSETTPRHLQVLVQIPSRPMNSCAPTLRRTTERRLEQCELGFDKWREKTEPQITCPHHSHSLGTASFLSRKRVVWGAPFRLQSITSFCCSRCPYLCHWGL